MVSETASIIEMATMDMNIDSTKSHLWRLVQTSSDDTQNAWRWLGASFAIIAEIWPNLLDKDDPYLHCGKAKLIVIEAWTMRLFMKKLGICLDRKSVV